ERVDGTQGKEAPLLTQCRQRCRARGAGLQEGHRQKRTGWSRRTREEPQAGNRDRSVGGAQEGQEGPEEGVEAKDDQKDDQEEKREEELEAEIRQALTPTGVKSC